VNSYETRRRMAELIVPVLRREFPSATIEVEDEELGPYAGVDVNVNIFVPPTLEELIDDGYEEDGQLFVNPGKEGPDTYEEVVEYLRSNRGDTRW
jgi:hypothetical protein